MQNNNLTVLIIIVFIVLLFVKIEIPLYIKKIFKNTLFKILFLSLLLIYTFEKSPYIALIVALVFVIITDSLTFDETKKNFAYLESLKTQIAKNKNKDRYKNKRKIKNKLK
ncbi:hypothetical protein Indivirus_1_14 [Indivirus ILV1]|uniref:Uncharacterized protein n=1 Tax=Indivirus ILV1 TaxID=1977633 RepID=A0A1V0SCH1_9VIRU|nr:hypothetical protein Indivirus_1_14 [Indivirus ILV1]